MKKILSIILFGVMVFCLWGCNLFGIDNPFPGTWINEEYGIKVEFTEKTFSSYYKMDGDDWNIQCLTYTKDNEEKELRLVDINYEPGELTHNGFETIFASFAADYNLRDEGVSFKNIFVLYEYYIDQNGNLAGTFVDNQGQNIGSLFGDEIVLTKQ